MLRHVKCCVHFSLPYFGFRLGQMLLQIPAWIMCKSMDFSNSISASVFLYPLVVSMDEDKELIGNLKVSLEAAKALTGIYQEFHQKDETKREEKTDEEEEEEEKSEEEQEEEKEKQQIQVIDYDDDSDFY